MIQSAIKDFLVHCTFEKNLSGRTTKAYTIDLLQFNAFFIKRGFSTDLGMVTKREIREYLISLSDLKPRSIKRKVASLKAMFNYLEYEDKIEVSPLRKMRISIRDEKKLPTVMNISEMSRIFKAAYERKGFIKNKDSYSYMESLRNIAIIELLFATGARVSEIAGLKLKDVNLTSGNIIIKGKGNKERIIQICNRETLRAIKEYSKLNESCIRSSGGFLLTNRCGNAISDQSIRNVVKQLRSKARLDKHITPHIFRHSFATLLLEKDVDIKYIQSLLGHSSIMTTQIYTHVNAEQQRKILKAKHPRKDFSMIGNPSE